YAPVRNLAGQVIAVVVIEASANFFTILDKFQNGLFLGIFLSILVVLLYGVFIAWAVTYFVRLQENAQRNEKLAAMGHMAATVAHEIRNPLGIIKSTAEVLRDLVQPDGKQKELFEFIPSEVDRLNRLVSDFLTFAREKSLKMERQNIVETVGKAVADIHQECKDSEVELVYSKEKNEILADHNPDGIRQVVLNLVMNSIQAMENSGFIEIELTTGTKWGRKVIQIGVVDNGPGVVGDPGKIFEPFFTTKTTGSGLGLAITKQIIEKHGGTIETAKPDSGGLAVYFAIPL
ncbi:MAG: nitrogen regulation protein NR(II), partial [bacterium]